MQLSDEQQRVLGDAVEVVYACPGAGKTRAIVARFLQDVESSTKGVALVSFTNAAVDEISARLKPYGRFPSPNFVGTFDRFVHQFIVTPYVLRTSRVKPRYIDSWNDLGSADWLYLRDGSVPGKGIALSDFITDVDGVISFSSSPNEDSRRYKQQLDSAGISLDSITLRAKTVIEGLLARRIYDCDNARILALKILNGTIADPGGQRVAIRFSEIIVDEFQDCSDIEYKIRESLKSMGIRVVVVADPDQGIYEFRNARPQMFSTLVEETACGAVVELNDNYRSSEAICSLVTSLRRISSSKVVSRRNFGGVAVASKVYVLIGSDGFKRETFQALAEKYDVSTEDSFVLAPTRKQAAILAGNSSAGFERGYGDTGNLLVMLARLRCSRVSSQRTGVLSGFTSLVLGMFDWTSVQLDRATVDEKLEHLGLQPEALRLSLSRLARSSSGWSSKDDAKNAIQSAIAAIVSGLAMETTSSVRTKFPKPRDDDWVMWNSVNASTTVVVNHNHIHGVKGREFPAVLLHVPHKNMYGELSGLNSWLADTDTETRRVLYVGASRAERLLALSIAKTKKGDLISILERDGVPYDLRIEGA